MPSGPVHRAESLRSENSDTSQNKRVSFNNDVDVKHIPRGAVLDRQGKPVGFSPPKDINLIYGVHKEPPKLSEEEIAREAERIIQQVDQISCTVSPNPLTYDTRSLERKSRKNNQNEERNNWSRTLPSSSTRNKLLIETKNNKVVEKNYLNQNQQATDMSRNKKLDPILETSREAITDLSSMDNSKEVFTPKYDSGIEMENHHLLYQAEKPPLARRNVNLIVQQLTEESRHREQLRRRYEEEGIDIAPRMPRLSIVEPDPTIGLSHNRNLPFSYTGGSPTRLSPLRTVRTAQSPEGRRSPPANDMKYSVDPGVKDNRHQDSSKRALHEVLENTKGQSPERNLYRSVKGVNEKVPAHGKFFSSHPLQHEEDDVDSIKARFLFGDHHQRRDSHDEEDKFHRPYKTQLIVEEPSSLSYPETIEDSENHYKPYKDVSRDLYYGASRNNKQEKGTSYNYRNESNTYSVKVNERPGEFTTKVLPTTDRVYHENRVFQYSDDEDYKNGPESYDYFIRQDKKRSPSPEPVPKRYPQVRTIGLNSRSPDRLDSPERHLAHNRQEIHFVNQTESRRPYYEEEEETDEPPIPPIRTKRRSQQNSPSRPIEIAKKSNNSDRDLNSRSTQSYPNQWNHTAETNTSLERPLYRKKETQRVQSGDLPRQQHDARDTYRYPSPQRERPRYYKDEVEKRSSSSHSGTAEPVKREKIQRQREKFLAAFLGIGKNNKTQKSKKKGARKSPTPVYAKREEPYEDWENQKQDNTRSLKHKSARSDEVKVQTLTKKSEKQTPLLYEPRDEPNAAWEDRDYSSSLKRGQRSTEVNVHPIKGAKQVGRKSPSPSRDHRRGSYEDWESREYTRSLQRDEVRGQRMNEVKGQYIESEKQRGRKSPSPVREVRQGSYDDWDNRDYSHSLKRGEIRGQRVTDVKRRTSSTDIENHNSRSKVEKQGARRSPTPVREPYEDWDNQEYTRSLKRGEVRGQRVAEVKGRHLITINGDNQSRGQTEKLGSRKKSPAPVYRDGDGAWEDWESPDYTGGLKREEVKRDITHKDPRGQRGKEVKGQDQRNRWESRADHEVRVADRNTPNGRLDEKRFRPRKPKSPERFDSSESEETRATRLRNARYKSQSHSNLYYRRDEEVRMEQEDHDENHNWNSATLNRLEHRSRRRDTTERQPREARPYASTQMLYRESVERDSRIRYFGDTDRESQQSSGDGGGRYARHEARGRAARTASNTVADVGAVRKGIMTRHAVPSHSQQQNQHINSSESEAGSQADSGASQRSVYLHAATVADIPSVPGGNSVPITRSSRVQSRDDIAAQSSVDTLRRAKHTSRSFSVLAPWKPRHYREKYEITYTNNQMPVTIATDQYNVSANTLGKPPRPPSRKRQDSIGDPVGSQQGTVHRSSTSAKRNGITGWFRRKKR